MRAIPQPSFDQFSIFNIDTFGCVFQLSLSCSTNRFVVEFLIPIRKGSTNDHV